MIGKMIHRKSLKNKKHTTNIFKRNWNKTIQRAWKVGRTGNLHHEIVVVSKNKYYQIGFGVDESDFSVISGKLLPGNVDGVLTITEIDPDRTRARNPVRKNGYKVLEVRDEVNDEEVLARAKLLKADMPKYNLYRQNCQGIAEYLLTGVGRDRILVDENATDEPEHNIPYAYSAFAGDGIDEPIHNIPYA